MSLTRDPATNLELELLRAAREETTPARARARALAVLGFTAPRTAISDSLCATKNQQARAGLIYLLKHGGRN